MRSTASNAGTPGQWPALRYMGAFPGRVTTYGQAGAPRYNCPLSPYVPASAFPTKLRKYNIEIAGQLRAFSLFLLLSPSLLGVHPVYTQPN